MARNCVGDDGKMRAEAWGLNPSPRSGPFRRFLAALLGIEEPTVNDMRNAEKAIEREQAGEGNRSPEKLFCYSLDLSQAKLQVAP